MHGLLATHRGLVPLAGILLCGAGGIILTQLSFQVGALGATLPANLAADPVVGVVLGAVLLREHIPLSAGHLILYVLLPGRGRGRGDPARRSDGRRHGDAAVRPSPPDPAPPSDGPAPR